MSVERWQKLTSWPLISVSWLFIAVYSWQVIADLHGPAHLVARAVMAATWLVFAVDYLVQFALSEHKRHWFSRHLFDLLVVILPALRPLRMLKALTVIRRLQRTTGTALRSGIAVYGAGAAIILIWIASLAVLEAERSAPGATIVSFGDAVWWAFVTIATVGYGDYAPVTITGRVVAVMLMCSGLAVVGVITATLSSWVIERAATVTQGAVSQGAVTKDSTQDAVTEDSATGTDARQQLN